LHRYQSFKSNNFTPLFSIEEYTEYYGKRNFRCNKCSTEFEFELLYYKPVPRCLTCNPKSTSLIEHELRKYISEYYSGIIEYSNRTILPTKRELDVYIPDLNLAFELHGLYWHTSDNPRVSDKMTPTYHQEKTLQCKEKGITLISIFSDDWEYKKDIVKHRIKSLLQTNTPLYARKCKIQEINSKDAQEFINKYHVQGANTGAKYNIGLMYNDELVSVMTLGTSRFNTNYQYEIFRFCSSVNIVGACSKMFSYFVKKHNPTSVISYANLEYGFGNVYKHLGFILKSCTAPGFWYVHPTRNMREHRLNYTKQSLIDKGYDAALTADEIMISRGYYKVFDCGNIVYEWVKPL
jgi:hypothetical protein